MEISVSIEAMFGLNWPLWRKIISQVEQIGFAGLYRSDHFMVGKPGADSLDLITSLTFLADHSSRIHFGSLVAPISFHHPVMLARQAMAIDHLSGGRMILGLGAGWHAEEHLMYGYELGDNAARLSRLEEGLEVIHALVHSEKPVDFIGDYFRLRQAELLPRSPVRLMVGGNGPKRTLPLAAKFADIWNCQVAEPAVFRAMNLNLDELVVAAGRSPAEVKRTVILPVLCERSEGDIERHIALIQKHAPPFSESSIDHIKAWLHSLKGIIGSPQQVVDGLAAYQRMGAEEIILEWFSLYDEEGLQVLGEEVLPHFR